MAEEVKGLKEAISSLEEFGGAKFKNRALSRALRTAAKSVLPLMIQLANRLTGVLKANLKVRSGKRKKNSVSMNVGNTRGSPAFYGIMVDRGWTDESGKHHEGSFFAEKAGTETVTQQNEGFNSVINEEVKKIFNLNGPQ